MNNLQKYKEWVSHIKYYMYTKIRELTKDVFINKMNEFQELKTGIDKRGTLLFPECWLQGLAQYPCYLVHHSLYVFLWDYVKDIVILDAINLKQKITDDIAIDEDMLQWTWQKTEYRFDVLRAINADPYRDVIN